MIIDYIVPILFAGMLTGTLAAGIPSSIPTSKATTPANDYYDLAACAELTSAATDAEVEGDMAQCLQDFGWTAQDAVAEAKRVVGETQA